MNNWLENLKVGDKVIVCRIRSETLTKVTGITKTQIKVESTSSKFKRSTGSSVGGSGYFTPWLAEATEERISDLRLSLRRQKALDTISEIDWDSLPIEVLEEVVVNAQVSG